VANAVRHGFVPLGTLGLAHDQAPKAFSHGATSGNRFGQTPKAF
jgi:hypothetical protein